MSTSTAVVRSVVVVGGTRVVLGCLWVCLVVIGVGREGREAARRRSDKSLLRMTRLRQIASSRDERVLTARTAIAKAGHPGPHS